MNIDNLVYAAREGNPEAQERVLAAFEPLVQAAARQRHLKPIAEDALAEARLSLWLAIRSFDASRGVPFAGYAKAKVYNDLYSFFKRERRYWQREVLPEQLADENGETLFDRIEDLHDGTREFIAISELLDPLEPEQRLLLRRLYIEGRTQQETAAELGISQSTVAARVKKALDILRTA